MVERERERERESIPLVVTDPPYGMKYHSNHYKDGNPHRKIIGDSSFPIEALSSILGIASNAAFIFCRWDNLQEIPPPKSFIVWEKNNGSAGDLKHGYARQWEGIAFYPKAGHRFINGRPSDIIRAKRVPPTRLEHPTQKPVDLLQEIIRHNAGDIVLDPFAGSGSTLIAALLEGRKAIGIEMDERYCDVTLKRLRDYHLIP